MSSKVKVVGYSKSVIINGDIQYRNFSSDLVGQQLSSDGGTPLFTMGNFSITTNLEPKNSRNFITTYFSNFVTLSDLNIPFTESTNILDNNLSVSLNLDKTNLGYYTLFGSLTEFVRVSLEDIIIKWPASLYMNPFSENGVGNTYENYTYDTLTEISSFRVNTSFIKNNFEINYLSNGTILDTFNATNDLRNITINYTSYNILYGNVEFPVIGFTGSTYITNDYIYFTVKGDVFSGQPSASNFTYHVKPNELNYNKFFNGLPDFESYLLNRITLPLFTSTFKYPIKTDLGVILNISSTLTWPVSDGYNIDFDTNPYLEYVSSLLNLAENNDSNSSNLINRFLVSESISGFDTLPVYLSDLDEDTSGGKINKTLNIYGRSFDDLNRFITGIEFANVVTYDKQNNTPDAYLKDIASVLGWGLISSVVENDLLNNYLTPSNSSFSGQSVGLTPVQADIELWRRLILNTPWIWKSKGARKTVEFLLRFIGAPQGLIKFNEYIYKASGPIDTDLFIKVLGLMDLSTDLSNYPIDSDGYPSPLPDTTDMYFQNYGLWYRETGGNGSTIDILTGNNPHLGPYDGGFKYINQFKTLIADFSAVTIQTESLIYKTKNLFTNYNLGEITSYSGETYVSGYTLNDTSLDGCIVVDTRIIVDPYPTVITDCGCPTDLIDDSLSICVSSSPFVKTRPCPSLYGNPSVTSSGYLLFPYLQYNPNGTIYEDSSNNPILNQSIYSNKECCVSKGGKPINYPQLDTDGYICCVANNCGCFVACKWTVDFEPIRLPIISNQYNGGQNQYLVFNRQDGSKSVITTDGSNCLSTYTTLVPNITDPYTGEIGVGCKLTNFGVNDLNLGVNSVIYRTYQSRSNGTISCCGRLKK